MAYSKVNTSLIFDKATRLRQLNNALSEEMESSARIMEVLGEVWEGEAYQSLQTSYLRFAGKYFGHYREMLESYSEYLQNIVVTGFTEAEEENIAAAEGFHNGIS